MMSFSKLRHLSRRVISSSGVSRQLSQKLTEDAVIVKTDTVTEAQISGKPKLDRPPFVKGLFLGHFDTNVLTYPEVLDKEELQCLNELVAPVERFFSEVDSKAIDQSGAIPDKILESLKSLGLFGQQIPVEFGGLGLNATEYARLGEVIALDGSIAVTLAAHQAIGLKGILIAGTEEQKKKYLPHLATGEWIAAFCLTEPSSGSDAASIQTRAKLSEDGKSWILNGSKLWISNGGLANIFTVFAKAEVENHKGEKEEVVSAFIVERDFGGVTSGKPEDKLGIRGSNTCAVFFDNTPVPVENVLGEIGGGFKLAVNILNSGRFSMGSSSAGILKKLIESTAEHAINRKQFGKQIKDFGLIQEKIAKVTCSTYAMESMAYLTAGMLDTYKNPDCAIEAAIVKVFSSEALWHSVSECLQVLGGLGYMRDSACERILRDSRIAMIFEGTNEILRIFISLMGLQHAGIQLSETVRKIRNPAMNPGFILSKLWERRRQQMDDPKLILGLEGYLHPSLQVPAQMLEYCVLRLPYAVEVVLSRHGQKIVDHQMELRRIADIVIDIFAMTAVLGRASRSYCIGLQHAESEVLIAGTFCKDALLRVKSAVKEIELGPVATNDSNYSKVAEKIFENKGYFPVHPLTRNF
ncbi:complex I assembly factor ACAD9, mitochondrial-like [Schistocerca piceifrons]|uniref:complex I assembly factor ACAD9, mitochondrial-like n=1 Tax=Schistocerca piceifrons TaxID=274613 RepID=UPI001F5E6B18|nr:complex I assembly factor ACAD9, mitochondrial-like [Schistocerca piceifrons]